jgi:hypothetical protein
MKYVKFSEQVWLPIVFLVLEYRSVAIRDAYHWQTLTNFED